MHVKNASSGMLTHLQAPVKLVRTSDLWFRSINAAWKQSLRIFSHGFMRCTEIPVGSNAPFSSAYWNSLRCIMHPSNSPSVETDAGSRPIMLLPPLYLKPHIWLQPPVICAPGVSHFGAPDCFGKMIPGDFQQHSPAITWHLIEGNRAIGDRRRKLYRRVLASCICFCRLFVCCCIEQFLKTFLGTPDTIR